MSNNLINLGLHYHIPSILKDGKIFTTAFFGVFIDSIAVESKTLTYYSYSPKKDDLNQMDYELKSKNVSLFSLGELNRFSYCKFIFHSKRRNLLLTSVNKLDLVLVRAPTALSYIFNRTITQVSVLLVGDFPSRRQLNELSLISNIYNSLLYKWMKINQKRLLKSSIVFVNNNLLYNKFKNHSKKMCHIKTSTFNSDDIFYRKDTCQQSIIKLLFVGRIEESKGLYELYDSLAALKKSTYNFHLSVVGNPTKKEFLNELDNYAAKLGLDNNISHLGYITLGSKLFETYKSNDIFVLPTKFDAFPRTITEAMSQSLPVITTNVGGIPMRLKNKRNALLVNPGKSCELTNAIITLVSNDNLRKSIINEGTKLAKVSTLESQSKIMFEKFSEIMVKQ
jgi:glycosyltransferase involved in cell wall biosynthesis